jgi:hypothetical protein
MYDPETLTTTVHVPMRDKRQPVTVTAVAEGKISALGEPHNRQVILADVRRLLGDRCPPQVGDVDAVLHLDAPGRADAIARLGGPFARVIEFATPEESSQQLGRVIVGAPALADEPYDLQANFTLFRGGRAERHTIHVKGTTESHILDTPFAFDGPVRTMHWEAQVKITWRGETLIYTHHSQPLFPTIYAWRAVVYNREQEPIALERVMDDAGHVDDALNWKAYVQTSARLESVHQPYAVHFRGEYQQQLRAGEPLAAYVTTTVISPDEREAVIWFQSGGPTQFYLNGHKVEQLPVEEEKEVRPLFREARKTALVFLRAGENTLVVDTKPPHEGHLIWFFGGALTTPEGEWMTDLVFE